MNSWKSIIFGFVVLQNFLGTQVEAHCNDAKSNPLTAHLYPKSFGYDPSVMPPTENDEPLNVEISLIIREIGSLKPESYRVQITLRQKFTDSRLKHKGKEVYLQGEYVKSIWSPDTHFRNERTSQLHGSINPYAYAKINQNGEVLLSHMLSIEASCPFLKEKLENHRNATCHLDIGSYGLPNTTLNYVWKEVPSSVFFGANAFAFLGQDIAFSVFHVDTCHSVTNTGTYACLRISFRFEKTSN